MNSIEKTWRNFLKECINNGEWVTKDDGDEILEITDNHAFITNVVDDVVMQGQAFNLDIFLKLIGMGAFNITGYPITDLALQGYVKQLDDPTQIYLTEDEYGNQPFIYTYPNRLFNVHQVTRDDKIVDCNQVETIITRLREHSGSNRAVANLYMCALDKDEQHIPCLQVVQCLIRNNELSLHIYFRSNDLYSAYPSNMLFLQYLGLKITEELKTEYPLLKFKGIYYNSTSLHIYRGDYKQAKKVIGE